MRQKPSKYLIVGEAPGEQEELKGEPFVGPTGNLVTGFVGSIGLTRDDFDITNVCHYRPPGNKLEPWVKSADSRFTDGVVELQRLLDDHDYKAILAFGHYALFALTGKRGITHHRGSVYQVSSRHRTVPVLATFHPAKCFRDPKDANIIFRDLAKFKRLLAGNLSATPERRLLLGPHKAALELWADIHVRKADWLAVDIETPRGRVQEIGFAVSGRDAVCVEVSEETVPLIRELLLLPCAKVFHNAMYDWPFLEYVEGWTVGGDVHDTMLAHHTLYPELPKSLDFCASIYTDEPYWKDLGGDKDRANRLKYNALDVAITAEIHPVLLQKLRGIGLYDTYERDRLMLPIAKAMSLRGVRYDLQEAGRLQAKLTRDWKRWQYLLNRYSGLEEEKCKAIYEKWDTLVSKKRTLGLNAMSHQGVSKLLYEVLGLPVQKKRKSKGTDEESQTTGQAKLLNLYPTLTDKRAKRVIRALLTVRQARKLLSSYLKITVPPDGRLRTSLGVASTETGRWNASAFLIGLEGTNLQTVPPQWKSCFVSDEGKLLFYADYSQIEARLVGYDAEDLEQIKVFENPKGDIHRENAARILSKTPPEVTEHERQVVGKTVHALNYDVGPYTLAEQINKRGLETGVWVTRKFTKDLKAKYLDIYKQVTAWQDRQWQQVKNTKVLTNHLGRRRIFLGPTKGGFAHMTRGEAIAFVPQSDVPDMLNIAMQRLSKEPWCELLLQVHDAVLGQIPVEGFKENCKRIQELMNVPLEIRGRTCTVPVDVKIGQRWSDLVKPDRWK